MPLSAFFETQSQSKKNSDLVWKYRVSAFSGMKNISGELPGMNAF